MKILLITGASSDIGSALIQHVAADYDKILCHYGHSIIKINALREQFGDRIVPLQADFFIPSEIDRMAADIIRKDMIPTHFVHLPAIPNANTKFQKTEWSSYDAQLTVQVRSAYTLCHAILPVMAKLKFGRIIFMLTENIARNMPGKFAVPYTTAKYALFGLMKCLAAEYADKGITINGVSPSMIDTAFVANIPDVVRQLNAEANQLKRLLTPEDVVPTISYLLSDDTSMLTGQNIAILGGN